MSKIEQKTTADVILDQLGENPSKMIDDIEGSVLADYYTDHNMGVEADAVRWMVSNRKRPYSVKGEGTWFNGDKTAPYLGDDESDLPEILYAKLGGNETANHKEFATCREAFEGFIQVFKTCKSEGLPIPDRYEKPQPEEKKEEQPNDSE